MRPGCLEFIGIGTVMLSGADAARMAVVAVVVVAATTVIVPLNAFKLSV